MAVPAEARPNTHAPAISTWDARASSIAFGIGRAVSSDADLTFASYSANFSSTSGILSAQFGVHYANYRENAGLPETRGFSAGGVALLEFPLAARLDDGVPRSAFALYVGGVPTALFSGELNFISVPLVLGAGLPLAAARWVSFVPWLELSPGLNFDTRITAVSTASAVAAASDGTLTQDEVRALVDQGLHIQRSTSLGKRAGLSVALRMGRSADLNLNLMLGAGDALSIGAGLAVRWDAMVPGVSATPGVVAARATGVGARATVPSRAANSSAAAPPNCRAAPAPAPGYAALQAELETCRARLSPPSRTAEPADSAASAGFPPLMAAPTSVAPAPTSDAPATASAAARRKNALHPEGAEPAQAPRPKLDVDALPPLQAAPPRPR